MENGISDNRNSNNRDGAKDKGGKTDIDDCVISTKDPHPEYKDYTAEFDGVFVSDIDSNRNSDNEVIDIVHLECSDGVVIDAEPFKFDSRVVQSRYRCRFFGIMEVESSSETLEMVKVFCEGRSKIRDSYAPRENFHKLLLQDLKAIAKPMKLFDSKFLQEYQTYALELIIAAFDLEIISLIVLMMEEVVNLFTTEMTEDKVYNFFYVNLKEYREDKFDLMKQVLSTCLEFLGRDWNPNLLKLKFHSLQSHKQRQQWLTAHFLLRCPSRAQYYRGYFKESAADEEDEKR